MRYDFEHLDDFLDDNVVISDEVKAMSNEQLRAEIARLEAELDAQNEEKRKKPYKHTFQHLAQKQGAFLCKPTQSAPNNPSKGLTFIDKTAFYHQIFTKKNQNPLDKLNEMGYNYRCMGIVFPVNGRYKMRENERRSLEIWGR